MPSDSHGAACISASVLRPPSSSSSDLSPRGPRFLVRFLHIKLHGAHTWTAACVIQSRAGVDRRVSMYRRARSLKTGQVRGQIGCIGWH